MAEGTAARQRHRLRRELQRLRIHRQLSQHEAAQALGWSESKINRIEGGFVGVTPTDLRALLGLYDVTEDAAIERLTAWARESRRQPWSAFRDLHSQVYLRYLAQEGVASHLCEFQPMFLPGLVQTRAYSRALLADVDLGATPDIVERVLASRAQRQELLHDPDCPRIEIVLDEAVVLRRFRDATVMPAQLGRLVELSRHPRITLQVMPMSAPAYTGLAAGFILLDFDDEPSMVYLESAQTEMNADSDPEGTERYRRAFRRMRRAALSVADTRARLAQIAGEAAR